MSTEAFEEFYFNTCTMDYTKMSRAMDPLKDLMERTDKVRIVAPGTDLTFSIKDIPVVKCDGELNIPDGEIFTSPNANTTEGEIFVDLPVNYGGNDISGIYLRFEDGRIVEYSAEVGFEHLEAIIETDDGIVINPQGEISVEADTGANAQGGVGITLTKANHVFHFDRWWNPAVENQATDRAFRIGQTRNVQVHKFVCVGTLEEMIDEMIESKKALAESVVGQGENWLTEL